jgi:hypothetical protein
MFVAVGRSETVVLKSACSQSLMRNMSSSFLWYGFNHVCMGRKYLEPPKPLIGIVVEVNKCYPLFFMCTVLGVSPNIA